MELFSTMDNDALHARLDRFGPAPCYYYPMARLFKSMSTECLAQRLWEAQSMIRELEENLVSAHAELVANGADA